MRVIKTVVDLLIPPKCVACGKSLLCDEEHLCLNCLADMPLTYFWTTPHNKMADAFNELIQRSLSDDDPYEPYSRAMALFYYQGEYEHLTKAVKYGGNAPLGIWLGRMLGRRLLEAGFSGAGKVCNIPVGERPESLPGGLLPESLPEGLSPESLPGGMPAKASKGATLPPVTAVVPVPLHWHRRWKRGYNQAELIARGVAEAIGAPLRTDILRKVRSTPTQTKLSQQERLANVAAAFRANPAALASLHNSTSTLHTAPTPATPGPPSLDNPGSPSLVIPSEAEESHILLIDDVFTTGATLFSARQALLAANNALGNESSVKPRLKISIATLAYA